MTNLSRIDFHAGEALHRVASSYVTILAVVLEQVQNALDADAKTITVVLNRKTRHIAIRDDGTGAGAASFETALQQVCRSQKVSGKLGRFGIGLISPIGKCEYSTFTSFDAEVGRYNEWTFRTADIRKQQRDVTIPLKMRDDLHFIRGKQQSAPKGKTSVMWRTEVNIFKYTDDKFISRIDDIDSLADTIFAEFGAKMVRLRTVLNLKFYDEKGAQEVREGLRPRQFSGRPLADVIMKEPDVGKIFIQLYIAPKTTKGQAGKVLVGEADNDFRIPMPVFFASLEGMLSQEVGEALCSGIFEGEILSEGIKLHVTRKSFERNDALVGFCHALEKWYKEHGEKHMEEVKEARREQRYQELGLQSLRELEQLMMNDAAFANLRKVLDTFELGSVGRGHAAPPESKVKGPQPERSLSTKLVSPPSPSNGGDGGDSSEKERKSHHPFTVAGPRGQQRTVVKNGSFGLQFSHVPIDGSSQLWELDTREGILHLNTNHPLWTLCESKDRKICQLQETVAINALMIEMMPDDLKDGMRFMFDETLPLILHLYHMSPAFSFRKATPPK